MNHVVRCHVADRFVEPLVVLVLHEAGDDPLQLPGAVVVSTKSHTASRRPSHHFVFLPLSRKTLIASKCRPLEAPRTLGERLKAWRLERGLEQRGVAGNGLGPASELQPPRPLTVRIGGFAWRPRMPTAFGSRA